MRTTPEVVRELLDYDPDTGILIWKIRDAKWFEKGRNCPQWNARYAGRRAGKVWTLAKGYRNRQIGIFGKNYYEHRIVWMWMTDEPIPEHIDHINRDATDNRWRNLRSATAQTNNLNLSMRSNNKSGITGVSWNKAVGRWHARCSVNGKLHHVGYFDEIDDAAKAIAAHRESVGFDKSHGVDFPIYRSAI